MRPVSLAVLLLSGVVSRVSGQNATLPGELELRSHYETIAALLSYEGDVNWNNSGQIEYRETATKEWKLGHPLSRIEENRLAGSLFALKPDTAYEVRITIMDPDGVRDPVVLGKIATRSEVFPCGSGKTYYVSPNGDDSGDGSKGRPFRRVQKAHDVAKPGDTILVMPGVYREIVRITSSGTAEAHILYKAGGKGVILDGSDALIAKDPRAKGWTQDDWEPVGDNIYVYARPVRADLSDVAVVDDQRLVSYGTLEELKTLPANTNNGPTSGYYGNSLGGYYLDRQSGKAYVRTRDDRDPDEYTVNISAEPRPGIYIEGAKYVIIDGVEIRHFGSTFREPAIRINHAADYCVIQNCTLHGSVMGAAVDKSQYITFQDNLVYDNMPYALDWRGDYGAYRADKARHTHTQGVSFEGAYENHVIRRNRVIGFVDGIVLSDGAGHRYENYDIYENEITESRDDALELDCDDINVKVWGNRIYENHSAVSVSGCEVGPLYLFRNLICRYFNESYKLHARSRSGPIFIYNNTMVSLWPSEDVEVGRGLEISFGRGMNIAANQYLTMKNNIFVGASWARVDEGAPRSPRYVVEDYNCWFTTHESRFFNINRREYQSLREFQRATGKEKSGLSADPRFLSKSSRRGFSQLVWRQRVAVFLRLKCSH